MTEEKFPNHTYKKLHGKISKRGTREQIRQNVKRTLELISEHRSNNYIIDVLSKELNKSKSQINKYIKAAFDSLEEQDKRHVNKIKSKFKLGLEKDLQEAYENYTRLDPEDSKRILWFKMYLEIKDRLILFIPKEVEDDKQAITVSYSVIDPKVIEHKVEE